MLSQPTNHNMMQPALDNKSVGDSLNISFKMSISTPNEPHNGLLISTGIQNGNNNYQDDVNNSIFYNSNGKNMLQILKNIEKNLLINTNEIKIPNVLMSNTSNLNSETASKSSIETHPIDASSNTVAALLSSPKLQKKEKNLLDSAIDSDFSKLQNNKTHSILTYTNNNNKLINSSYLKTIESNENFLENETNHLNKFSSIKPKSCIKDKSVEKSKLSPLLNLTKTNFATQLSESTSTLESQNNCNKNLTPFIDSTKINLDDNLMFDNIDFEEHSSIINRPKIKNYCNNDTTKHNLENDTNNKLIKLNLFEQDDTVALNNNNTNLCNNAIELYMPSNFDREMDNKQIKDHILNDSKTTTTIIEVFREKVNEAQNPIEYLRLPPGPFDTSSKHELITVHGPKYQKMLKSETEFGNYDSYNQNKNKIGTKIRWQDTAVNTFSPTLSNDLSYIVKEPSNLSLSTYQTNGKNSFYKNENLSHSNSQIDNSSNSIFNSKQNLNKNLQFDQFKKYTPLRSSPSFNSLWNLSDETDNDNASVTTILRCQQQEHNTEHLKPNLVNCSLTSINRPSTPLQKDKKIIYSRICTPSVTNLFNQSNELKCPPIPPKRISLQRINSQPNLIIEHQQTNNEERIAPPRPTSEKPFWLQHSRPIRTQCDEYSLFNNNQKYYMHNYQQQKQQQYRSKLSKNQSVSSNEIFKLYQTRDCLGNVLFKF